MSNRPNKHSKSKSNTLHFRGRHSIINRYKSKIRNTNSKSSQSDAKSNCKSNGLPTDNNHNNTCPKNSTSPCLEPSFKLPPLTQLGNNSNNHSITQCIIQTSPSVSTQSTYYNSIQNRNTSRVDTDTVVSLSSEYQTFNQTPHSPSASFSFSDNNSYTNPDFIVIEPQTTHNYPFHNNTQKHFYQTYHSTQSTQSTQSTRPHSTQSTQNSTFKFDDSHSKNNNHNTMVKNVQITPTPQTIQTIQTTQTPVQSSVQSPSQISQLSQSERYQQLQLHPSSTQMTPTPSPGAPNNPNWNNTQSLPPITLESTPASQYKPRKYGSRSHLMDMDMDNSNNNEENESAENSETNKNVRIGQATMRPYRVYNEYSLDKPANSIKSINSATYSIDTQHSISHSSNTNGIEPQQIETRRDKLSNIRIKLTPTTSTPIKSPNHNGLHHHKIHNNMTWQTYIGHFVFHEHDRGHSLYHSFKKIGEGVFARVYKTVRKEPQRTVALKVFPKKNKYAEGSFANELMLLHNVSHPNIVKLYDAHVDPKYFYLEMEVCRGGDIFKYISRKGRITEAYTRQIIYKILDAIHCFHERDFVHRDLKPENIVFVDSNDITDIRLIDFGESIHVSPQSYYNEFVGTPCYFAPERFRQHTGAELKKSDVWAIGVIMFEMLTGSRCFAGGNNTAQVKYNVLNKKMEQWPTNVTSKLSSNAMDFFNKLLEYEPLKRYSSQQALKHDWLIQLSDTRSSHYMSDVSPRLTPIQNAQTVESMQAIVIKTSQSMSNLQAMFRQQIETRKQQKKIQRKFSESNNEQKKENDENEEENGHSVPWKLRITRKKSRSLEQNELRTTLRNKDGTNKLHRLSLPKQSKYRIKHRSATLSNHHSLNKSIDRAEEEHEKEEFEDQTHVLKHQKSLSSPAMNISINKNENVLNVLNVNGYHPSPVHEDYEQNDSTHTHTQSAGWSHTNID